MSLLETDPDVVDYLLRRKASQWVNHIKNKNKTPQCINVWRFTFDDVLLYESQELRSAADWGALHPKWVPLLQRLQQGVQWWGVPLWQQLPSDEWATSRTGQPGRWAAFPHPGTLRCGGACDQLEQRIWKLGQSSAHSQCLSPVSRSSMTNLLLSLDTISEEHANIWGAWHTTLKPILKDQQFTGKQYTG